MDEKILREYAEGHGKAIVEGDDAHAQADLAPEFQRSANSIAATLPHPVSAYKVVSLTMTGGFGRVRIKYDGVGPSLIVESDWEMRGGRPILFDARPIS